MKIELKRLNSLNEFVFEIKCVSSKYKNIEVDKLDLCRIFEIGTEVIRELQRQINELRNKQ